MLYLNFRFSWFNHLFYVKRPSAIIVRIVTMAWEVVELCAFMDFTLLHHIGDDDGAWINFLYVHGW